jgi:hypothetical protein
MTQIITCGRGKHTATYGQNDLEAFFEKSGVLGDEPLMHTPFLAFRVDQGAVVVSIVHSAHDLIRYYADDVKVMVQWAGKYRSDYFQMTVGDVRKALQDRHLLPLERLARERAERYCSKCGARTTMKSVGQVCFRLRDRDGLPCTGIIEAKIDT